ncbi:NnrS family protein [Methylomonas sp. AM2-LC]|uniref:NnrS family protein n=1 Tax=Methylomonas sp. AM2-LC TaxID=3153301 RepID=UPI003262DBD8
MNKKPIFDYPLFAMGFRTFFALAGLSALAFIALWNSISDGSLHLLNYFPQNIWHAHEMLLGYTTAVIAGFLLTAVRNWTGLQTVTPDELAALGFLWIYGRIAPFYAHLLPDIIIAGLDFAFLPVLAYFIAKPLLKKANYKNFIFVVLLLLMAVANGLIHAQFLGLLVDSASLGLKLLVTLVVMMIVIIAGRLFPYFTERGLSGVVCIRNPLLDGITILVSLLALILMILDISGTYLAIAAVMALLINLVRVASWYDGRIWYVPLLWVLFVGYGWIILGFGLLSLAAFAWISPLLALHAFTVGGLGTLTLGMMARVALGHTGRALKASNIMAIAFLLINLAALCRVLFPVLVPAWSGNLVLVSSYFWLAAFSLFVFFYTPILTTPRVDGQAG